MIPQEESIMDPGARIGHAEREEALGRIGDALSSGHLNEDEFDQRSKAAGQARRWGEIDPLVVDLPHKNKTKTTTSIPLNKYSQVQYENHFYSGWAWGAGVTITIFMLMLALSGLL